MKNNFDNLTNKILQKNLTKNLTKLNKIFLSNPGPSCRSLIQHKINSIRQILHQTKMSLNCSPWASFLNISFNSLFIFRDWRKYMSFRIDYLPIMEQWPHQVMYFPAWPTSQTIWYWIQINTICYRFLFTSISNIATSKSSKGVITHQSHISKSVLRSPHSLYKVIQIFP